MRIDTFLCCCCLFLHNSFHILYNTLVCTSCSYLICIAIFLACFNLAISTAIYLHLLHYHEFTFYSQFFYFLVFYYICLFFSCFAYWKRIHTHVPASSIHWLRIRHGACSGTYLPLLLVLLLLPLLQYVVSLLLLPCMPPLPTTIALPPLLAYFLFISSNKISQNKQQQ